MGGEGSGRPTKEMSLVRSMTQPKTPIATNGSVAGELFLPNHSGIAVHPEFKKAIGEIDLTPYWKSDGTSTATGNWSLGENNLSLGKNIDLANTTTTTTGVISKDGTAFLHNFKHPTGNTAIPEGYNVFLGEAGNFTMGSGATITAHGSYNTGIGKDALSSATTGFNNIGIGVDALKLLTSGYTNIAVGNNALSKVTTGYQNSAFGSSAGSLVTTGNSNTLIGGTAGEYLTTGNANTFIGISAGGNLETGSGNIAIGAFSGEFVFKGSGNNNVYIGANTISSSDDSTNEIAIGYNAVGKGSNTVTIGNSLITDNYFSGTINGDGLNISGNADIGGNVDIDGYLTPASKWGNSDAYISMVIEDFINPADGKVAWLTGYGLKGDTSAFGIKNGLFIMEDGDSVTPNPLIRFFRSGWGAPVASIQFDITANELTLQAPEHNWRVGNNMAGDVKMTLSSTELNIVDDLVVAGGPAQNIALKVGTPTSNRVGGEQIRVDSANNRVVGYQWASAGDPVYSMYRPNFNANNAQNQVRMYSWDIADDTIIYKGDGDTHFLFNVEVDGDVTIDNNLTVSNNLFLEGDYYNSGNQGFTGNCINTTYSGGIAIACND